MKRCLTLSLVTLLLFVLLAGCAPAGNDTATVYFPSETTPLASPGSLPVYPSPDPDMISQQLAMDIALLNAGVDADEAEFMQVEFDYEDRNPVFEVSFYVGHMEYEYEIDANNGSILYFEIDRD